MKAILEFDLSDAEDIIDHKQCIKANDMAIAIWTFAHNTKKELEWKLDGLDSADKYTGLDLAFEKFAEILNDYNINPEELCP